MIRSHPLAPFVLAVLLALGASSTASAAMTQCRLTYDLEGWSAFYKTSKGSGRITCSNGQSARVTGAGPNTQVHRLSRRHYIP